MLPGTVRVDVGAHERAGWWRRIVESRVPCSRLTLPVLRPLARAPGHVLLEHDDAPPGVEEHERRRESGDPGAHDDHVGVVVDAGQVEAARSSSIEVMHGPVNAARPPPSPP